jgi:hypothetical protein
MKAHAGRGCKRTFRSLGPHRYAALFFRRARAYARAVLRELPGSSDDLRSTHSFLVTGTYRGGFRLALFSGVARMQMVRGRLAGSRAVICSRSATQAPLGAGHLQQLWSFIGHPARLSVPAICMRSITHS